MRETKARELVRKRANGRCEVCGGNGYQYSHRRRRSVPDHRWCPCNGLLACATCHVRMHQGPKTARTVGWHVSIFDEPAQVPVLLFGGRYWLLDCTGNATEVMDSPA